MSQPDVPVSMVLEELTFSQQKLARLECLKTAMLLCKVEPVSPDDFSSALDRILPVAAHLEKLTGFNLSKAAPPA